MILQLPKKKFQTAKFIKPDEMDVCGDGLKITVNQANSGFDDIKQYLNIIDSTKNLKANKKELKCDICRGALKEFSVMPTHYEENDKAITLNFIRI